MGFREAGEWVKLLDERDAENARLRSDLATTRNAEAGWRLRSMEAEAERDRLREEARPIQHQNECLRAALADVRSARDAAQWALVGALSRLVIEERRIGPNRPPESIRAAIRQIREESGRAAEGYYAIEEERDRLRDLARRLAAAWPEFGRPSVLLYRGSDGAWWLETPRGDPWPSVTAGPHASKEGAILAALEAAEEARAKMEARLPRPSPTEGGSDDA